MAMAYARHAQAGRIVPSSIHKDLDLKPEKPKAPEVLSALAATNDLAAQLETYHPTHEQFLALKQQLTLLRYLVVATGCLGAPGLADELEAAICGPAFSRDRSSFAGIVVPLSRLTDFGQLGLQFVHASDGFGELTLRSDPGETGGTFFTVASGVVLGEIAPYSARRSLTLQGLGEPLEDVVLDLSSGTSGSSLGTQSWLGALAPNDITLVDGRAYTLVLIGAGVGAAEGLWWNAPMLTVVDNDPVDD
jgi:hypothetical protein